MPASSATCARFVSRSLLLTVAAAVPAQAPNAWATLAVPSGVTAGNIVNLGKVIGYRDGNSVHAWSAVTRNWQTQVVVGTPTTRAFNDCVLVVEAGAAHAMASGRGVFASIALGPNAIVRNGTTSNNDSVVVIEDGAALHTFSSFTGAWATRSAPAGLTISVQRHTAILAAGAMLSGYDAFTGQWHDLAVTAVPWALTADGTAAFAEHGGTVHAFSATHRRWTTHPVAVGSAFLRGDDFGVWIGGGDVLGYSSLQDRWEPARVAGTLGTAHDLFALVDTAHGKRAFSACTGTWSAVLGTSGAAFVAGGSVVLVQDGGGVRGWSAVNGRTEIWPSPTLGMQAVGVVATTIDSNSHPVVWSGLTGKWYRAPAAALPGNPALTTTTASIASSTGVFAFHARTGGFVPLTTPGVAWSSNPSSAPLIAWDSSNLWAFEGRAGRWLAAPRAGTGTPNVGIWRTCALVLDGATAFGFGTPAGIWASTPLPGPVLGTRVNSESARVHTANAVLAFPAIGELVPQAQFPEFRRVQAAGADLDVVMAIPAGGFGLLAIGPLSPTPLPIPGLGDLLLSSFVAPPLLVTGNANGEPITLHLAPSVATALRGREWGMQAAMLQAAILPPMGMPWLTAAATVLPL